MTFDIYLPSKDNDTQVTFYTSIEADDEQQAQEKAEEMQKKGEIPEFYPY